MKIFSAQQNDMFPLVCEVDFSDPVLVFSQFAEQDGAVLFDSAQAVSALSRYSFIAVDPFQTLTSKDDAVENPFALLRDALTQYPLVTQPELPPFQGGVAGFFSYDLCHHLEELPRTQTDDMQFPDMAVGFYDLVIAFDLQEKRAWIFSSGYPEQDPVSRKQRAEERCQWLENCLRDAPKLADVTSSFVASVLPSHFDQVSYASTVQRVIDYILAGDIFEANLSQRFVADLPDELTPFDLYRRLRKLSSAPFAAYLKFADTVIASASPERFVKLTSGQVETRPIKGTRPRGETPEQDAAFASELKASEKDIAENVMIVDLMRNDLSRVCQDDSVNVSQLCALESFATVHHLVSVVEGKMQEGLGPVDLLEATFPGGSITGAPKIRAMEIIAELEPTKRGPYCGSIGYIGFNGDMDTSITIRTYAIKDNKVTFQAGGAVVADSDPIEEYIETLAKADALQKALKVNHD